MAGDRAIAGCTAANCVWIVLWRGVMYRYCRGYCARRGCDVEVVAVGTALGEGVMHRELHEGTALLPDRVSLAELRRPYRESDCISGRMMQNRIQCQGLINAVPVSTGEYLVKYL